MVSTVARQMVSPDHRQGRLQLLLEAPSEATWETGER